MTLYESKALFISNSAISIAKYIVWKDSVGFDGNKTECFECYCERLNQDEVVRRL